MKSEKIKISVVSFTGNSGLTDYSVSLCKELVKKYKISFITADSYDGDKYKVNFPYFKVFRRTRHYPIDIFKFIYHVLKNKPDVILFQSWLKYPLFEILIVKLFRLIGIKTALTIHDLLPHYPMVWSKFTLKYYYKSFDKIVVHSKRSLDGLNDMGISISPLLVPHGVYDIFNFDKYTRSEIQNEFPAITNDDFVLLFFGHIDARKGILEFLKASELLDNVKDIKFLVAGGNSLSINDTEIMNTFRTKTNIILHDRRISIDEVQKYLTISSIVVLPYLEGTTSGVIKLAMAFDKPVIVSDIGDFSETLKDWSGELISVDKLSENLASSILKIKGDYPSYLRKIEGVKDKYQWDYIADEHIKYLL